MAKGGKNKKGDSNAHEPVIENRRARHDYCIERSLEVGIVLRGSEVKSVRAGQVSLGEGYVRAEADPVSLTLHGVHIGEYGPARGINQHTPVRARPLLAHKREIVKLATDAQAKGSTILPLKMYFKDGRAKLLIGVARGKQSHDKREDLKTREAQRDIQRAMSKRV